MNDGIYKPMDAGRFAQYQQGMRRLVRRVRADGIPITLLTPTPFDPRLSMAKAKEREAKGEHGFNSPYERYDDVLARYSDWLLDQRRTWDRFEDWDVIDLHSPLKDAELTARQLDPAFALAGDGVHPGAFGHWLMARQILRAWHLQPEEEFPGPDAPPTRGKPATAPAAHPETELLKLITKRRKILSDAWLTQIGHKRPGMAKGLPIEEATKKAAELEEEIRKYGKVGK